MKKILENNKNCLYSAAAANFTDLTCTHGNGQEKNTCIHHAYGLDTHTWKRRFILLVSAIW